MKTPTSPYSDKAIALLLTRYKCPTPLGAVRTALLGNIASPILDASPLATIESLWRGQMPTFESGEDAEELYGALLRGLWNRLAEHQSARNPFRLLREPFELTRPGLRALALLRKQEIAGFVDGLFGSEDQLHLPEKAHQSVQKLAEAHSMFAAAADLLADETKPASEQELKAFAHHAQQMTIIAEEHINRALQSCRRARTRHLEQMAATPTDRRAFRRDDEEPPFVESPLSQDITRNGVTVQVQIYGDEEGEWILEVVDRDNTSHVWDEHFRTDAEALAEAIRALEEEPIEFLGKPRSTGDVH